MTGGRHGDAIYAALARLGGLALVLVSVAFQRRGLMHWTELVFLGACIGLQETFLRLHRLHRLRKYRNVMLVAYSMLPLALMAIRAPEIMAFRGEFVPLILNTPLPLVLVSVQIMVLYLREGPRLTSVVLVLAMFSAVVGVRRNVGDAVWPWLAAICAYGSLYLMLQHPGVLLSSLQHALAGRPTTQSQGARPASVLRLGFALAVPVLVASTVATAAFLFFAVPRPSLRGEEVIAPTGPAPPGPQTGDSNLPRGDGRAPTGPRTNDPTVSGLSDGVNLGDFGQIQLDKREALSLRPQQANQANPIYLRAYTFSTFNGNQWLPLKEDRAARTDIPESQRRTLPNAPVSAGPMWRRASYDVLLHAGSMGTGGELPLPVEPGALRNLNGTLTYSPVDHTVRAPLLQPETTYTVDSVEIAAGETELGQRLQRGIAPAGAVHREYLELPGRLLASVRGAYGYFDEIDPKKIGAYAAARRIVANFRDKRTSRGEKTWRYSLQFRPDAGRNPIVRFLDTSEAGQQRYGHCEYFASGMAVLLRCHGIPARVCAGFIARKPDETGLYNVTFADAHAWVEAWMPEFGWMTFDPTPPDDGAFTPPPNQGAPPDIDAGQVAPDSAVDAAGPDGQADAREVDPFRDFDSTIRSEWLEKLSSWTSSATQGFGELLARATAWMPAMVPANPWLRGALLFAPPALLVLLLAGFRRRRRLKVAQLLGESVRDGHKRERGLYAQLLLLLARYGHAKQPHETPLEFAQRVRAKAGPVHEPLPELTRLYYGFRFGSRAALVEDFKRALSRYAASLKGSTSEAHPG